MLIERSQRMLHVEMSTESAMCGGITGRVSVGGIPLGVGMVAIGIGNRQCRFDSFESYMDCTKSTLYMCVFLSRSFHIFTLLVASSVTVQSLLMSLLRPAHP